MCGDLFEQLEKDTVIRKHYQLVVALYRDQNQLESLRPGDVVNNERSLQFFNILSSINFSRWPTSTYCI